MTVIIGLTGSIATGKTTVSKMFEQLNIPVVDADKIAREVVEPGKEAFKKIVQSFGNTILHEDDTLNRKALGEIVFNDKEKLETLNNIVHPAIREEMARQKQMHIDAEESSVVLDIPLLYENKLEHLVDKIVVVYIDESIQLERLMKRDKSTKEEALSRISSQIPIKDKVDRADATINNNGTIEQTYEQLKDLLTRWDIPLE